MFSWRPQRGTSVTASPPQIQHLELRWLQVYINERNVAKLSQNMSLNRKSQLSSESIYGPEVPTDFLDFIANNRERKSSTNSSLMKFLFLTGFCLNADVLLVHRHKSVRL